MAGWLRSEVKGPRSPEVLSTRSRRRRGQGQAEGPLPAHGTRGKALGPGKVAVTGSSSSCHLWDVLGTHRAEDPTPFRHAEPPPGPESGPNPNSSPVLACQKGLCSGLQRAPRPRPPLPTPSGTCVLATWATARASTGSEGLLDRPREGVCRTEAQGRPPQQACPRRHGDPWWLKGERLGWCGTCCSGTQSRAGLGSPGGLAVSPSSPGVGPHMAGQSPQGPELWMTKAAPGQRPHGPGGRPEPLEGGGWA